MIKNMGKVCISAVIAACYPLFVSMIMQAILEVDGIEIGDIIIFPLFILPAVGFFLAVTMINFLENKTNDVLPRLLRIYFYFQFIIYTTINVLTAYAYEFLYTKMEYINAVEQFYQR